MKISFGNEELELHSSGAAYWRKKEMLLISDVHLGKISHFRKYGSAVPAEAISQNFKSLDNLIQAFQPKIICFLGDLFHSAINTEWRLFEEWVSNFNGKIILVAGNHDIISPLRYQQLGIEICEEMQSEALLLTHHPEKREGLYNMCGHIHPGYRLSGIGKQFLKLPCFYKSEDQLIFPSFGTFTGNYMISPQVGEEVYAITKKEVILVYSEK